MNPRPDLPSALQNSLAADAAELPGLAASEARRYRGRRFWRRRQLVGLLVVVLVGVCSWQGFRLAQRPRSEAGADSARRAAVPTAAQPVEFVKVQTMQEAMSNPLPHPAGISKDQKELLEAARGLPLLLVMDRAGKLVRIHVIER
jgi:hypothetical protein